VLYWIGINNYTENRIMNLEFFFYLRHGMIWVWDDLKILDQRGQTNAFDLMNQRYIKFQVYKIPYILL